MVRWEKCGVSVISTPAQHGGGLYIRIPKKVVDAYDIAEADYVQIEIVKLGYEEREEPTKGEVSESEW